MRSHRDSIKVVPRTAGTAISGGLKAGLLSGIGAYLLWGVLPIYFLFLAPVGALEVVAHRVVWSLFFCISLVAATRSFSGLWKVFRDPRLFGTFVGAALLIGINWTAYVWAIETHHAADAALGYFINPIVTSLLAVMVLRERLLPAQALALALTVIAVVVIAVGYGRLPWISLVLAFSFGLYGLLKNRVGPSATAIVGLSAETLILTPFALAYLGFLAGNGESSWGSAGTLLSAAWLMVFLTLSGLVTAVPLLLFAAAARRLPLIALGSLQYMAPILQLLIAVFVLREPMPLSRWIGFALVWLALCVITFDAVRRSRRNRSPRIVEAASSESESG